MDYSENGPMNYANNKLNNYSFKCVNLLKVDLKLNTSEKYARQCIGEIF